MKVFLERIHRQLMIVLLTYLVTIRVSARLSLQSNHLAMTTTTDMNNIQYILQIKSVHRTKREYFPILRTSQVVTRVSVSLSQNPIL